jgi:hypothetical protein
MPIASAEIGRSLVVVVKSPSTSHVLLVEPFADSLTVVLSATVDLSPSRLLYRIAIYSARAFRRATILAGLVFLQEWVFSFSFEGLF